MICPNSYFYTHHKNIKTTETKIAIKPAKGDNKISFKHIMTDPVMFINVKAKHDESNKEHFYKTI